MSRIALLTCERLPEPDVDEALTVDALRAAGHAVDLLAWDAPTRPPAYYDACVIRSTWNYIWHEAAFLAFLEAAERDCRLMNPLAAVRWNLHKRYLEQLAAAGVRITPTLWLARGEPATLAGVQARGWRDFVVKPAVSAASFATRRFRADEPAQAALAFLAPLLAERDVMIQPYVPSVERGGERALVWIDGELTHAVAKSPRFSEEDEAVSAALRPTPAERAFAEATLAAVPAAVRDTLLYARIDVFEDGAGGLMLSELELIEPSLFFAQHPPALATFVAAVGRRLG